MNTSRWFVRIALLVLAGLGLWALGAPKSVMNTLGVGPGRPKKTPMIRLSKIAAAGALGLLFTVVVFGNLTDYGTNLAFIQHVLTMDTTLPDSSIRYRAITSPIMQHGAYVVIIAIEAVAAGLCWTGAVLMSLRRTDTAVAFSTAKAPAIAGLTLSYLLWQIGLFAIGNEWFGMWMSREWNGVDSAFRFLVMTLGALIYVSLPDPEVT